MLYETAIQTMLPELTYTKGTRVDDCCESSSKKKVAYKINSEISSFHAAPTSSKTLRPALACALP